MMESGIRQGRGSAGAYATTNKSNRGLFFFFYCYSSFLLLTLWSSDSKFDCNGGGGSTGAVMVGATDHTVGGSTNRWDLGVDYDTWASANTFYVGDNLGGYP